MKRLAMLMLIPAAALTLAGCTTYSGAPAVGHWGGVEQKPFIDFDTSGTFSGNDGCNPFMGSWYQKGENMVLKDTAVGLMACEGVDTWLSSAATVRVEGATMLVFNTENKLIGELPRTK